MYREEHPNPMRLREDWISLNGEWQFEIDNSEVGLDKRFFERESLDGKIIVPFCPESRLSGVGNTDFMNAVWYRREFEVPESFFGKRIILHFGAVDYEAKVFINGKEAGGHKGGYTAFSFDITKMLKSGKNTVIVYARDNMRCGNYPMGKQSKRFSSYECFYTRTTGIWQTVWLEAVGETYVENYKVYADIDNKSVTFNVKLEGDILNKSLKTIVTYNGKKVGEAENCICSKNVNVCISLEELHLWDIACGNLYDVEFIVSENEEEIDLMKGYFGMRSISYCEKGFMLNGKIFFGRFVLDQGYYPGGIYTAPDDEALKNDILYSMQLGFNGARLHQKIFEPRFLYWADKLGYMVWEEMGNWNWDCTRTDSIETFIPEWLEAMERDFSHPSIIGWCPLNETWDVEGRKQSDALVSLIYKITKAVDPTRLVVDTSGNYHTEQFEIYDVHDYEQNPDVFRDFYKDADKGIIRESVNRDNTWWARQHYRGEMIFMSEYGGIKWDKVHPEGWGYGNAPDSEEEFLERYKHLTESILNNKKMCGFCYTQLYDVEQECNGLLTYERKFKFDPEIFRKINTRIAEVEK